MNNIRTTRELFQIEKPKRWPVADQVTRKPITYLSRWRIAALILRLTGVYLLFCVFWIGWQYAGEFVFDIQMDFDLDSKQDLAYSLLSLLFLTLGMSVLLWIIWRTFCKALRPLRRTASRRHIQALETLLQYK